MPSMFSKQLSECLQIGVESPELEAALQFLQRLGVRSCADIQLLDQVDLIAHFNLVDARKLLQLGKTEELRDLRARVEALEKDSWCGAGIKDGRIPDSAMTASSEFNHNTVACHGRLDHPWFWHPAAGGIDGSWLQVDFGIPTCLVGVVTQGRGESPEFNDWVKSFKILYGNDTAHLTTIQDEGRDKIFQGNRDKHSHVTNIFPHSITARFFRIAVVTYARRPVLRIEYLTS